MANRYMRAALLFLIVLAAGFLAACNGIDGHMGSNGMGGGGMGGVGHMASAGVVSPKPEDATQVAVTMSEWAVAPAQASVKAGKVYFLVKNAGPAHAHEFVIIRTDVGPLALPFKDNEVPEDQVDFIDEIKEYAPNSSASLTVNLTPGKYLFICNITEAMPGIGSHYKKGMVATFRVE